MNERERTFWKCLFSKMDADSTLTIRGPIRVPLWWLFLVLAVCLGLIWITRGTI